MKNNMCSIHYPTAYRKRRPRHIQDDVLGKDSVKKVEGSLYSEGPDRCIQMYSDVFRCIQMYSDVFSNFWVLNSACIQEKPTEMKHNKINPLKKKRRLL
jgi:hypothetical protein